LGDTQLKDMKFIFLSGPISLGETASVEQQEIYKERFARFAHEIYMDGDVPLNPSLNKSKNWHDAMRQSIRQLMSADEVFMLPDWQESKGAILERYIAMRLEIPIRYIGY
jgi:hypothetical protein